MARDYYEILGVARGADKSEIKKAFRQLAREYHPDVSKHEDAESRFKEINEAYEVLSDDDKRARYDRFGHAGVAGNGGFSGTTGFSGFDEIFEEFINGFGGMYSSRRRGPRPGADLRVDVTLTFEESVFGVEKDITFERLETCAVCAGTKAEPGSSPRTCPQCNGSGKVHQVFQTPLGPLAQSASCPNCGGAGQIVDNPCHNCRGDGRVRQTVTRSVQIPAGVRDDMQIQIRGEGDAAEAPGAPNGNLYIFIRVQQHEYFQRRENDIILEMKINVAQAALGDRIMVPTIDDSVEMTIPAGTQSGKMFRLRGKGVPRLRTDGTTAGRGDQIVHIMVEVPQKLTEKQRALFEELADSLGSEVQPQPHGGRSFVDRFKDFFGAE